MHGLALYQDVLDQVKLEVAFAQELHHLPLDVVGIRHLDELTNGMTVALENARPSLPDLFVDILLAHAHLARKESNSLVELWF